MKITSAKCTYEMTNFKGKFGFKGSYINGAMQVTAKIETETEYGVGSCNYSVLWSDASIFAEYGGDKGNELMLCVTNYALSLLRGKEFTNPIDLIDSIYPEVLAYAKVVTKYGEKLKETFAKNALVCVDNALWQLYGKLSKTEDIMELIPENLKKPLTYQHKIVGNIPLITYALTKQDITNLLDSGMFVLKIKIGLDPTGKDDLGAMLEWDKARIKEIHEIAKNYKSDYTVSGNILYYLDANGRYDTLERLQGLLDFAKEEGILDRIILLEEPFAEENKIDVSSLPVRIVADESAHSLKDVEERIKLGYKAVALKAIAKTLSESLKILAKATEEGVECFCADLTVTPYVLEFNKNVASRIKPLPELKVGLLESNGEQNYVDWAKLTSFHPMADKKFVSCKNGVFTLDDEFFKVSGGIFRYSDHYDNINQ